VSAENKLMRALAAALLTGPKHAADMILKGPLLPEGANNVAELDALSKEPGPISGMAAYDAAYLLALLPPQKDVKKFWADIAARYELAAKKMQDKPWIEEARARAKAARETSRAVIE
jgi:hypothetical protein